jgi:hypothetical protein
MSFFTLIKIKMHVTIIKAIRTLTFPATIYAIRKETIMDILLYTKDLIFKLLSQQARLDTRHNPSESNKAISGVTKN